MTHRSGLIGLLAAAMGCAFALAAAVPTGEGRAAPLAQPTPFQTPTPGPDGKIIYIVQPGDSPWSIAAIAGITVEELMALNQLQSGDYITPGMRLQLGLGGPVVPTAEPGAAPTDTVPPPSPTPVFGTGEICVLLFADINGDARREEGEGPLEGGRVSVVTVEGAVAGEHTTDDTPEGFCFVDLPNGDYNVSGAVPPEHNPTTAMSLPVRLDPGNIKHVEFGAQPSSGVEGAGTGGGSTLLGVIGLALLVGAIGLGYYAFRFGRGSRRSF